MVPNGWLKTNFGAVTEIANGQVDPKVEPYLSMLHIGPENVVSDSGQIIDVVTCKESSLISGKYEFDENAIVYSKIRPNLNKVCRPRFKGVCSADMYPIWAKDELDIEFLLHYMLGPQFYKVAVAMSMRTGMPKINRNDLNTVTLLLPPVGEQKKIAQILSTWDQAITTTERLLDLARQQKKALMQQLLTGKKRFPRFEGEWKKYTLGELGDTFNGLTGKTKDDFGFGKKYIPYINIFKNSRIEVNALELVDVKESESQSLSQYGDIFFTTSSETPDEVGMSSVLLDHVDELYLNSFCFGYRLFGFESLQPEYARYLLRSEHVRREIAVLGQGATRYNLSKKQLMKLELTLPPVDEQKKIASVLSGADQEIETLQSQLDGLKQEKKALMQTLLTGKRRVQVN